MPAPNIHIAIAGGVPGYTVLWVMLNTNAHVTKKIMEHLTGLEIVVLPGYPWQTGQG
jgi:hypothetical protein